MKSILIPGLMALLLSGPVSLARACDCDKDCQNKCEQGKGEDCQCKDCDCAKKDKKCKHGKCKHHKDKAKAKGKADGAAQPTDDKAKEEAPKSE